MRWLALALTIAVALGSPARAQTNSFSPEPWLADLAQLRDAMTAGYANLEWQAQRGLDLRATYERGQARIKSARDDYQARRAIERFLATFGDGHLEVTWPAPRAVSKPAEDTSSGAVQPLCARLGYFDVRPDDGPALGLPDATLVGARASRFKAALISVGRRKVGVLRVPSFLPKGFPDLCDNVAAARGLTAASPCDNACQDAFDKAADSRFVDEMGRQLRALAATRPDVLLVDIAGNGGGDDSSLALARMLTAKPLRRSHGAGIMGEPWAQELADREAGVAKALATAPPARLLALQRFDTELKAAHDAALKACDRSPLWADRPITCTAMTPEPLYDGSWSSAPSPDDPVTQIRPIWIGPVMVLVDGNSASSSEWLAAVLQDSRAALVLGSPTFGAGCGHMTAAAAVKLANSGGMVSMPDCWRLRANGENEAAGVEPDVLIGFREHDPLSLKTVRLARALPEALKRLPVS